jgi:hypothetical protein
MVVTLSELESLSDQERKDRLAQLARAAQTSLECPSLDRQILAYEARFCMTSSDMEEALTKGALSETDEICQWLMCLKLRKRIEERRPT